MLSRKAGRNYVVLCDGERFPSKINRNRTDRTLEKLRSAMETIRKELKEVYDKDPELYDFLANEVFGNCEYSARDLSEGKIDWIDDVLCGVTSVQEFLANKDDVIEPEENITTLQDLGYEKSMSSRTGIWEKIIEDTDEREVAEEIVLRSDGETIRRKRTIIWEKTEHGKRSTDIRYKKLPIGKRLRKAIENTAEAARREK